MARIFLSYSREDRELAERIARLLEAAGFEVWWDRQISAGESYQDVLEKELHAADHMVVLWSRNSVDSDWVKEEAEEGRTVGKLVPVLIEQVHPPVGFRNLQAADLSDWDGSSDAAEFRRLLSDLESRTGQSVIPAPQTLGASKGGIFSKVTGTIGEFMERFRTRGQRATPPIESPMNHQGVNHDQNRQMAGARLLRRSLRKLELSKLSLFCLVSPRRDRLRPVQVLTRGLLRMSQRRSNWRKIT